MLVVRVAIGLRHQHADVLSADFVRRITEQPLGRGAEGGDLAELVDDDHRFRHGIQNGAQVRFALARWFCTLFISVTSLLVWVMGLA